MRLERAQIADVWWHLHVKNWPVPEHEYCLLVAETLAGSVWAGLDGDAPVAIGGVLVPSAELAGTAWLSILPGRGARSVTRAALLMRRAIRAAADVHPPGIVCCIGVGNGKGERLGRALGFAPTDRRVGNSREWRLQAWRVSAR